MISIYTIVNDFFTKGHQRTIKAKKNIIISFGLKGFNILVGFLLVPLTLNYLNPTKYGIWLTLSSIIGWFGFFDIGLGNGLRNKLAEAFALKNYKLAKSYVSTTYAILLLVISSMYILFLLINPFLDWSKLLNATPQMIDELSWLALIIFTFFSIRFVLQLIGVILSADQLPAFNSAFNSCGNLLSLIMIFFVTKFSRGNLLYIGGIYSAVPVLVLFIASIYLFNGKYKHIRPSIKYVKIKYFKSLAELGVNFFILQIACLVIFSTDNMIITQILGPSEVTPYNIAFKYFGLPIMLFSIVITPYWSAYTDAISQKDMKWIKNSINKLIKVWLLVVIGVILLLSISNYFYLMWVGDKVHVPFLLSIFMGFFAIISTWNNIFAYFINGVGKIRLQMYYGIMGMIINIPVSIFFAKYMGMGSAGVILGTCISLLFGTILGPIQYLKLIQSKAYGIWNK